MAKRGTPIRIEVAQGDLAPLREAASYLGMTLREFILHAARENAKRVVAGAYTGN